jgi:hypothetical protein
MSPLTPLGSPHTFTLIRDAKSADGGIYSPILAKAKIHIEPSSRPIPILPMHSTVDLSSASALGFSAGIGNIPDQKDQSGMRTKRFSTGPHPLLPSTISTEIHAFKLDSFAEQYFAKRRTGIMRTRVPIARLLTWQKAPITAPLLEATGKSCTKEAVIAFKVIQRAMCERDKPVEGARPLRANSVAELDSMPSNKQVGFGSAQKSTESQAANGKAQQNQPNWIGIGNGVEDEMGYGQDTNMQILQEVRWMIQVAVFAQDMRDEVYAQVVKQLTGNGSLYVHLRRKLY